MPTPWRAVFIVCLAATTAAGAQAADARGLVDGDVITESSAGFSWFSPGGSLGDVTHRRVYLIGIRGTWLKATAGPIAIAYSGELIPLIIVERTRPSGQTCWRGGDGRRICRLDRSDRVAVGAGAAPLGARFYFNRTSGSRVFASVGAGMLVFNSDVPVNNSRRENFTLDYGGGLELPTRGGALTIGYKFHHISNAGIGELNPGLDANVIYFGLIKRRRRA